MTRLPDWRTRLAIYLAQARARTFAYGSHDCVQFAAGAVKATTGTDFRVRLAVRKYATPRGARMALAQLGYSAPVPLVRSLLPEIPGCQARMGDLAVVATPEGPALAVVGGAMLFAPRAPGGLAVLPLTAALTAFEV